MNSISLAGIVLAAGKGTRMRSESPKCAYKICGEPMAGIIGQALIDSGVEKPVIIAGHGADVLQKALGEQYEYVLQKEQLGTGHAVLMAEPYLRDFEGTLIVVPGDAPLISSEVIKSLVEHHHKVEASITLATCYLEDPTGYGRVIRNAEGIPCNIVEDKDADLKTKQIKEVCTSLYCFDSKFLFQLLPLLSNQNNQQEYYLTEIVRLASEQGHRLSALVFDDADLLLGVNDLWQLAEVEKRFQSRILKNHALKGVRIVDPSSTFIDASVKLEPGVHLEPMCLLRGKTEIQSGARIGPNTLIVDSLIGEGCEILMSKIDSAQIGSHVRIGPFANVRPSTSLGSNVRVGNFVEIKNATVEESVSISHLTYLGDAFVGECSNIGAGTITCNYDGFSKHRTDIGKNAFVGSNSTLVAPVKIGNGAVVAAGSVIKENVPEDSLSFNRKNQEIKESWARGWRQRKQIGV